MPIEEPLAVEQYAAGALVPDNILRHDAPGIIVRFVCDVVAYRYAGGGVAVWPIRPLPRKLDYLVEGNAPSGSVLKGMPTQCWTLVRS